MQPTTRIACMGLALAAGLSLADCRRGADNAPPQAGTAMNPPTTQATGVGAGQAPFAGRRGGGGGFAATTLPVFQQRFAARFMQADTDHDGRISAQEWTAWRASRPNAKGDPARQFQRLDLNHDGYLTTDEINTFSARVFQRRQARRAGQAASPQSAAAEGNVEE